MVLLSREKGLLFKVRVYSPICLFSSSSNQGAAIMFSASFQLP